MSFKKLFIIALAVGGLTTAIQREVHARPEGSGHHMMKALFQDVSLTTDQKSALREMKPTKEERREMKAEWKGEKDKLDWLQDFADGKVSRDEILQEIEEKHLMKHEYKKEKLEGLLSVLSTLDASQKEQVLENLKNIKEKRHNWKEGHGKKGKKDSSFDGRKKGKFLNRMLEGISLTSAQKERKEAIQEFLSTKRVERVERKEMLMAFLSGETTKREILRKMNQKKTEILEHRQEGAQLWMDFIESLREDQQNQIFDYMQDMKEDFEEKRREKRNK